MSARPTTTKPVYRIRNWSQYNDALVRRGSLTLWVDEATLQAWWYQGPPQQGAQFQFSDLAIECLLTLRAVYHLTLRATEGFARSLFEWMVVDLSVPDYSTLCRRAKTVRIRLPKTAEGPLQLVLDSRATASNFRAFFVASAVMWGLGWACPAVSLWRKPLIFQELRCGGPEDLPILM